MFNNLAFLEQNDIDRRHPAMRAVQFAVGMDRSEIILGDNPFWQKLDVRKFGDLRSQARAAALQAVRLPRVVLNITVADILFKNNVNGLPVKNRVKKGERAFVFGSVTVSFFMGVSSIGLSIQGCIHE